MTCPSLDLLGSRAPYSVLEATPAALSASVDDLTEERMAHVERGEESVEHMTGLYAGHDLLHPAIMDELLSRTQGPREAAFPRFRGP